MINKPSIFLVIVLCYPALAHADWLSNLNQQSKKSRLEQVKKSDTAAQLAPIKKVMPAKKVNNSAPVKPQAIALNPENDAEENVGVIPKMPLQEGQLVRVYPNDSGITLESPPSLLHSNDLVKPEMAKGWKAQGTSAASSKENDSSALGPPPEMAPPPKTSVSFNELFTKDSESPSQEPKREDDSSWTRMSVSPDLPPKISQLGEDLIGSVTKQLPEVKSKRALMPYDEFRLRVRDAVLASPDVGVVDSQLGIAQAGKAESRSPLLPQVSGFTDSGRRTVGQDSYLGTPAYNRDGTNYGISVRQVLFDFGASYFGFQAGKAKEQAAIELVNTRRSEQALKSVISVIDLERARAQLNIANENAASRLSIVRLVRERFALGGGTKPDIVRAESRYADALATITNAQNRLKAAEAAYREAFANNPIGIVNGPNFEVPVEAINKTPQQLATTYPGLLQLAQLKDAANAEASSALAKMLPNFTLAYDNITNGVSAPLAPSQSTNLIVQLRYNFYTGGAETARKDSAQFKAKQAEFEFYAGLRQFERVVTQNQEEVRNSDALVAARRLAALSAMSSMRAVREQFAFNKGTLLDLLTVQENLFIAGRDLVDAEADRQIARYRFIHLSTGLDKLFELSEQTPDVKSLAK